MANDKTGARAATRGLPDPTDEATETIGAILWTTFARTASPKIVTPEVVAKGRELSWGFVHRNVEQHGPDGFPLDRTMHCAERCGELAKQYSEDSPTITVVAFEKAWQEVQSSQKQLFERFLKMRAGSSAEAPPVTMKGGACS